MKKFTAWDDFSKQIGELGPWLMSQEGVPQDDPQIHSDGYRYLATLLNVGLDIHLLNADPDRPQWTVTFTNYARYGGDQRDGTYHSTQIDPSGVYRIIGKAQGGLPATATIQTMSGWWTPGLPNKTVKTQSIFDFDLEPDGSFEMIIGGPSRSGNYMELTPDITHLMARQYIPDDSRGNLYALRIDRIDRPLTVPKEYDKPEALAEKLSNVTGFIKNLALAYLDTSRLAISMPNALEPLPDDLKADLGASQENEYYIGSWNLSEDEVLLIEIVPTEAAYWSVAAHNFWFQGLEHSSIPVQINNQDVVTDTDGKVRIIVSELDPGYANWIATGGLRIGVLAARWNFKKGNEKIETRTVKIEALDTFMLPDSLKLSAKEREQQLYHQDENPHPLSSLRITVVHQ
ncbi:MULTISPECIES: DUF1214 domain-containing protein [Okeania]|uniref:DUF1214 domain-containing protein n=1 Tax=Okeania hirsuta TaxID=1458930 RepID=A0A3N6NW02_9CYAN|nr:MULTISPECIES: DUF1214 domain-containing protein [Okeania]NET12698.1 DUF1214 domain-containing protein [Okeania sp. SIO1H6]NES75313.1 DUF1214 domain-containing protein [Okeania sp. SIO1H4]NES88237.1 DUF1214 domain-containing protein [Okeania sp. SIO2B9]NET19148.1 DUF1214 domain-containing protein [Okeania sp. SIO1H5]NET74992.1 DUF1214 domain-containing protein [Okeania sp. SIO1F9]